MAFTTFFVDMFSLLSVYNVVVFLLLIFYIKKKKDLSKKLTQFQLKVFKMKDTIILKSCILFKYVDYIFKKPLLNLE